MTPTKQEDNAKIALCSHGDLQFLGKYTEFISQALNAAQEFTQHVWPELPFKAEEKAPVQRGA